VANYPIQPWIASVVLIVMGVSALRAAERLELTAAERAWIAEHPVVRIQMGDASPPFEFKAGGKWQGLAYDHLLAACDRLGLRVEVIDVTWEQALASISNGRGVDLLLAVTRSPEREQQMLLSKPYLAFPQVIVADRHRQFISGLADLRQATVAVERDYVMESWLRRDLPQARFFTARDSLDVLVGVSQGQADAYVGNLALASWLIEKHGLVNLGVVAPSGYGDEEFSLGVRRDWPELVSLLDRALDSLTDVERRDLRQRWLTVRYEFGLRPLDIALWVCVVAAVALLFIVQLRRMVNARTRELAREVELRREGEARVRRLIELAPEAIVLLDPHSGRFIEANPEAERVYGVPRAQIIGASPEGFSPELQPDGELSRDKAQRVTAEAMAGRQPIFPWMHVHPDGTKVPCEVRLIALPWEGTTVIRCSVLDMRERQRHEEILRRTETLSSLGQLAGSIAHDFNNQLFGITGLAELIPRAPTKEKAEALTNKLHAAIQQARELTGRLLAFARRGNESPVLVDVHVPTTSAIELFVASRPGAIEVVQNLRAEQSTVRGFPSLLQNAILNLCFNARDAMAGTGRIEIRSENRSLDEAALASLAPYPLKPGEYLHLTVKDHGLGMTPEVLARCREPLFSTKGDKGTGLGLSGVHNCMLTHGGAVHIDSVPGRGTEVHLWLPLIRSAVCAT
jgi:two-component system, cell cycle sensor histidine kinase and response regulator CckA